MAPLMLVMGPRANGGGRRNARRRLVGALACAAAALAVGGSLPGPATSAILLAGDATIAPFGSTTAGPSSTFASPDYKFVSKFSLGEKGSVQKLSAYVHGFGTSGTQALKAVIYADASGTPGALQAVSSEVVLPFDAPKQWVDFVLPASVTLVPGDYWLGLHAGPRTGDALVYYSYAAVTATGQLKGDTYADGPSNPFGTGTVKDRSISIYATYLPTDPIPPLNASAPRIDGSAAVGATLGADPGSWSGSQPISYAFQWTRCDSAGANCAAIAGATSQSYVLVSGDAGKTLRVSIKASNSGGSSTAASAQTAVVNRDPVIAAAGDIACDPLAWNFNAGLGSSIACHQLYTSRLLSAGLSALLPLGDQQYECAPLTAFNNVYAPTWGRLKAITHPVPGNHEYLTENDFVGSTSAHTTCDATTSSPARGYFDYFGAAAGDRRKGYYGFDVGNWHLIALNSNCGRVGGCGYGSAQERWLHSELVKHKTACVLAYWHHPLYNSNALGAATAMRAMWQDLYDYGAELVLSGHAHDYERFAPQDASGRLNLARGVREFVVGTGGKSLSGSAPAFQPNSEIWNNDTYGVLELTLRAKGYAWKFLPEAGKSFTDSGSASCH